MPDNYDYPFRYQSSDEHQQAHEAHAVEQGKREQLRFESQLRSALAGEKVNPFWGATATVKRPTLATVGVEGAPLFTEQSLPKAQELWDTAHALDQQHAERQVEQKAKEDERAAAFAELEEQKRLRAREKLLAPARSAYFEGGGTEEGWAAAEAAIEARIREQTAVDAAVAGVAPLDRQRTAAFAKEFAR